MNVHRDGSKGFPIGLMAVGIAIAFGIGTLAVACAFAQVKDLEAFMAIEMWIDAALHELLGPPSGGEFKPWIIVYAAGSLALWGGAAWLLIYAFRRLKGEVR